MHFEDLNTELDTNICSCKYKWFAKAQPGQVPVRGLNIQIKAAEIKL